jgi:predicted small secreted protein
MFSYFRFSVLVSMTIIGLGLSACGTVQGAGRDIQSAGAVVQDAAD